MDLSAKAMSRRMVPGGFLVDAYIPGKFLNGSKARRKIPGRFHGPGGYSSPMVTTAVNIMLTMTREKNKGTLP